MGESRIALCFTTETKYWKSSNERFKQLHDNLKVLLVTLESCIFIWAIILVATSDISINEFSSKSWGPVLISLATMFLRFYHLSFDAVSLDWECACHTVSSLDIFPIVSFPSQSIQTLELILLILSHCWRVGLTIDPPNLRAVTNISDFLWAVISLMLMIFWQRKNIILPSKNWFSLNTWVTHFELKIKC